MKTRFWLEKIFHWAVDHWFEHRQQPRPPQERLKHCKIISHRGEYDNRSIIENTLPAFEAVKNHGIWGLELDVRWTKDLQPIVFHDRDTHRIFGQKAVISDLQLSELNARFPLIPTLEKVIQTFGKNLHLLVEIKAEAYPDPDHQNRVLSDLFSPLEPGQDFHLISMTPEMFEYIKFLPSQILLPIAKFNIRKMSNLAIQKNYGGILGHYLFLKDDLLRKHQNLGHHTGTGYIGSKNCLFRELNRQVEWLLSNNATKIQSILNSYCRDGSNR